MAFYSKDKNVRLNIRLSEEHDTFLEELCEMYGGLSRSQVVRMLIESYFWGMKRNADKQTDLNDQL